jgi:RNA polymerase sigma-70 factor, ECF subfamily
MDLQERNGPPAAAGIGFRGLIQRTIWNLSFKTSEPYMKTLMKPTSELKLISRMTMGDEQAFLELYNTWQGSIYRFAWQMTGSTNLAEDITQDVFMLLIRKKLHFDPSRGSFSSFIYGVARNLALRSLRKDRRFSGIMEAFGNQQSRETAENPLAQLTDEETANNLRRCVLSLPAKYREMIVLCDLHEMSYAEAAEVTNCSVGTVRSRLHRGRDLLVKKMQTSHDRAKKNEGGAPYEIPTF